MNAFDLIKQAEEGFKKGGRVLGYTDVKPPMQQEKITRMVKVSHNPITKNETNISYITSSIPARNIQPKIISPIILSQNDTVATPNYPNTDEIITINRKGEQITTEKETYYYGGGGGGGISTNNLDLKTILLIGGLLLGAIFLLKKVK